MLDGLEVFRMLVRTVHFASSVGLFGAFVFYLLIARPSRSDAASASRDGARRLAIVGAIWLTVVIASGALWLGAQAAVMSRRPFADAIGYETLSLVLTQTLFGQVWMLRAGLAVALTIALICLGRRIVGRDMIVVGVCALLAGALLATLAWAGHANIERGVDRVVHRTVDAVHLLAVGAWLGGLAPLATVLSRASDGGRPGALDHAARAAQRFSTLGILCVCTLAGTGFVNASYTVGSIAALSGTDYGRLLMVKLSLFAVMLVPATLNRARLTPLLATQAADVNGRASAARRLRRNTIIEIATGLAVLGVVGILGVTPPAMRG
jgi:copper resistance protein D